MERHDDELSRKRRLAILVMLAIELALIAVSVYGLIVGEVPGTGRHGNTESLRQDESPVLFWVGWSFWAGVTLAGGVYLVRLMRRVAGPRGDRSR